MCDGYVLTELTIQSIVSIEDHKTRDVQGQEPASNNTCYSDVISKHASMKSLALI